MQPNAGIANQASLEDRMPALAKTQIKQLLKIQTKQTYKIQTKQVHKIQSKWMHCTLKPVISYQLCKILK